VIIQEIRNDGDIESGMDHLRRVCPAARRMSAEAGPPPVRRGEPGFAGLARVVVGQQLSVASAGAIWVRCIDKLRPFTPDRIRRARVATLKSCGLSAGKIRTLKALADAVIDEQLKLDVPQVAGAAPDGALADDEHLRNGLLAVPGIGPWTVDIYLMFALGRPDVFAPGDLALQIGAQMAFDLDERPKPDELLVHVAPWSPVRAVGARLLWHYYAHRKRLGGAAPV